MSIGHVRGVGYLLGLVAATVFAVMPEPVNAWSSGYGSYSNRDQYRGSTSHYSRYYGSSGGYRNNRVQRSRCHQVSKRGYVNGRRATIVGTQCYGTDGSPYIVSGSRSVAGYR